MDLTGHFPSNTRDRRCPWGSYYTCYLLPYSNRTYRSLALSLLLHCHSNLLFYLPQFCYSSPLMLLVLFLHTSSKKNRHTDANLHLYVYFTSLQCDWSDCRRGGQRCWSISYPFTAPAVIPFIICSWNSKNTIIVGSTAIASAAIVNS